MGMAGKAEPAGMRLAQIDALRGVAALAVVLFHYTTAFPARYVPWLSTTIAVPHGYLGVNLFFIISGFVIFMTLARTRRPMDFVVSRFSRLFPAYWVAVGLTFGIVSAFGLPTKEVAAWQAIANLIMVHNIFFIPHVDGVYWTLEVELLFYVGMLALFITGRLQRVHRILWLMLAARLAYHLAQQRFGIEFSWTLYRLTILQYIPWFALGICIYQQVTGTGRTNHRERWVTVALALGCLAVVDGWMLAAVGLCLGLTVWAAAVGRLPWLDNAMLTFLGSISYTLYLLHENIGWVIQRAVVARGGSVDASVVVALTCSIVMASALTHMVERPAMQHMRDWYRQRRHLQTTP